MNPGCGGFAVEHVNSSGGGSVYCLDACGYEAVIPDGTKRPPRRERLEPVKPLERRPPPRRR